MECTSDVINNLWRCSKLVGVRADDDFNQDVFCEYGDLKIESPIEQLFYTSFKALVLLSRIPLHDSPCVNGEGASFGMLIHPQKQIKTYRVDFYIGWFGYFPQTVGGPERCVVVECDSQEWHERTEKERRYEKKRDRELASVGLDTFRFTGKEIKEDAFKPAIEVLNFLIKQDFSDVYDEIKNMESIDASH